MILHLWDSIAKDQPWVRRQWHLRENMVAGEKNIITEPLFHREKMILPPQHIKLGFMKQFVKTLKRDGTCFGYICREFREAKAGIFNGLHIQELMKDQRFQDSMDNIEACAWSLFCL